MEIITGYWLELEKELANTDSCLLPDEIEKEAEFPQKPASPCLHNHVE